MDPKLNDTLRDLWKQMLSAKLKIPVCETSLSQYHIHGKTQSTDKTQYQECDKHMYKHDRAHPISERADIDCGSPTPNLNPRHGLGLAPWWPAMVPMKKFSRRNSFGWLFFTSTVLLHSHSYCSSYTSLSPDINPNINASCWLSFGQWALMVNLTCSHMGNAKKNRTKYPVSLAVWVCGQFSPVWILPFSGCQNILSKHTKIHTENVKIQLWLECMV